MMNLLLSKSLLVEWLLYYGVCAAIILAALVVMAIIKNKTKKEMRAETVVKSCAKAKTYAQKILQDKAHVMLSASRLLRLNKYVGNCVWYAFQIASVKKDIVWEGIAGSLDSLSTALAKEAANGYITEEDFKNYVQNAIDVLDGAMEKAKTLVIVK